MQQAKNRSIGSTRCRRWSLPALLVIVILVGGFMMFGRTKSGCDRELPPEDAAQVVGLSLESPAGDEGEPIEGLPGTRRFRWPKAQPEGQTAPLVTVEQMRKLSEQIDAGEDPQRAADAILPSGYGRDGVIAALKLMMKSRSADDRCKALHVIGWLFTDDADVSNALASLSGLVAGNVVNGVIDLGEPQDVGDDAEGQDIADGDEEPDEGGTGGESGGPDPDQDGDDDLAESEHDDNEDDDEAESLTEEKDVPVEVEVVDPLYDEVQAASLKEMLLAGTTDEDVRVRHQAIDTTAQMEDTIRYAVYDAVMAGNDTELKLDVVERSSHIGRAEDLEIQRKAAQDADPAVKAQGEQNLVSPEAENFIKAESEGPIPDADEK